MSRILMRTAIEDGAQMAAQRELQRQIQEQVPPTMNITVEGCTIITDNIQWWNEWNCEALEFEWVD